MTQIQQDIQNWQTAKDRYWETQQKLVTVRNRIGAENDKTANIQKDTLKRGSKDLADALVRSQVNLEALKEMSGSIKETGEAISRLKGAITPDDPVEISINDPEDDEGRSATEAMEVGENADDKMNLITRVQSLADKTSRSAVRTSVRNAIAAVDKEAELDDIDIDIFYGDRPVAEMRAASMRSAERHLATRDAIEMSARLSGFELKELSVETPVLDAMARDKHETARKRLASTRVARSYPKSASLAQDDEAAEVAGISVLKNARDAAEIRQWTQRFQSLRTAALQDLRGSLETLKKLVEKNATLDAELRSQTDRLDREIKNSAINQEQKYLNAHVWNTSTIAGPANSTAKTAVQGIRHMDDIIRQEEANLNDDVDGFQQIVSDNKEWKKIEEQLNRELS